MIFLGGNAALSSVLSKETYPASPSVANVSTTESVKYETKDRLTFNG